MQRCTISKSSEQYCCKARAASAAALMSRNDHDDHDRCSHDAGRLDSTCTPAAGTQHARVCGDRTLVVQLLVCHCCRQAPDRDHAETIMNLIHDCSLFCKRARLARRCKYLPRTAASPLKHAVSQASGFTDLEASIISRSF